MTDIEEFVLPISQNEGCIRWMYCDEKGLVTVGIGNLLRTSLQATLLPFFKPDGSLASLDEKCYAYGVVKASFKEGANAYYYQNKSELRISYPDVQALLRKRLRTDFVPAAEKLFHDFWSWPQEARQATVDMMYSLGANEIVVGYPNLYQSLLDARFDISATECHRAKAGEDPNAKHTWGRRNSWTSRMYCEAWFTYQDSNRVRA
jgi:hypothetical protein